MLLIVLIQTQMFSLSRELASLLSPEMAAVLQGILVFTLSVASWQYRSLSMMAQILQPMLHQSRFSSFHHWPLGLLGTDT